MMTISYRGLKSSIKGKALWHITCLSLIWSVWRERNARIFENKERTPETIWDLIHVYSSFGHSISCHSRASLSMLFSSTSIQCVGHKGSNNEERKFIMILSNRDVVIPYLMVVKMFTTSFNWEVLCWFSMSSFDWEVLCWFFSFGSTLMYRSSYYIGVCFSFFFV